MAKLTKKEKQMRTQFLIAQKIIKRPLLNVSSRRLKRRLNTMEKMYHLISVGSINNKKDEKTTFDFFGNSFENIKEPFNPYQVAERFEKYFNALRIQIKRSQGTEVTSLEDPEEAWEKLEKS